MTEDPPIARASISIVDGKHMVGPPDQSLSDGSARHGLATHDGGGVVRVVVGDQQHLQPNVGRQLDLQGGGQHNSHAAHAYTQGRSQPPSASPNAPTSHSLTDVNGNRWTVPPGQPVLHLPTGLHPPYAMMQPPPPPVQQQQQPSRAPRHTGGRTSQPSASAPASTSATTTPTTNTTTTMQPPLPPEDPEHIGLQLAQVISQLQSDRNTMTELLHRRAHHQFIVDVNQEAVNAIEEQLAPLRERLQKAAGLFRPEHFTGLTPEDGGGGIFTSSLTNPNGAGNGHGEPAANISANGNGTSTGKSSKNRKSKSNTNANAHQAPAPVRNGPIPISSADIMASATAASTLPSSYQGILRFDNPASTPSAAPLSINSTGTSVSRKRPRESPSLAVQSHVAIFGHPPVGTAAYQLEDMDDGDDDDSNKKAKRATAIPFNDDDKHDMIQYLRVVGQGKTTAKFWQNFADLHPRHSALSWAIYYKRHRAEIEPNGMPSNSPEDGTANNSMVNSLANGVDVTGSVTGDLGGGVGGGLGGGDDDAQAQLLSLLGGEGMGQSVGMGGGTG
ncbi:hypothetical protein DACRYDRAFT_115692 [Dacryopinax primogenitus]|uniref:Uncharacterized protein n=1 Tax=Dacryopinax primogenitus (strain DJM 731) TaxID=1858805 RepID=M5G9W6_DACPD|nr:uncharacterized protein DACRYDRAFT_115692 [Dacryopinax primogenitus]EJU02672.1 hypothetical protein DACRYDRAFT_115692 [Dacryopinax primogenitus]